MVSVDVHDEINGLSISDIKKRVSGKTIAMVTHRGLDHLFPSEEVLMRSLRKYEFRCDAVAWDDESVPWLDYDVVLLRACWNYYLDYQRFCKWIQFIEDSEIPLWNPPEVIRWNMSKTYLGGLANRKKIHVIPTHFVERGSQVDLRDILETKAWTEGVIKPMIGAGAFETYRTNLGSASHMQRKFENILKDRGVMVQPFVPEILKGEYSLIFIANKYSHTVLRKPRSNDFRVGYGHGGTEELIIPRQRLRQQVEAVVAEINTPLLYARVDGIDTAEGFLLMEIELIEPRLSFDLFPNGAERLAQAMAMMSPTFKGEIK
ncbi:MAG: hypothetical protein KGI19_06790 [Thaumarchaeota archaeon]|nr:hypothetical protein [Nitrososphaerota archaeon]